MNSPQFSVRILLLCSACLASPALAQEQPAPPESVTPGETPRPAEQPTSASDIIVNAVVPRDSVVSDIPPEEVLDETAIASFGASNVADLVGQLATQSRGNRGRGGGQPVVLLNGRRISGFQEMRNIPPEAIQRVEVFPEEVALEYGYAADQRVLNIVLRPNFSAVTSEIESGGATQGGYWTQEGELSYLLLNGRSRINLTASYDHGTMLTEAERNLIQPVSTIPLTSGGVVTGLNGGEIDPALSAIAGRQVTLAGVPGNGGTLAAFAAATPGEALDPAAVRSLRPTTDNLVFDGTFALPLGPRGGVSITLNYDVTNSSGLLGLRPVSVVIPVGAAGAPFSQPVLLTRAPGGEPLRSENRSRTFAAGASTDGRLNAWRWTLTGSYNRGYSAVETGRGLDQSAFAAAVLTGFNAFDPALTLADFPLRADRNRTLTSRSEADGVLNGPLFALPAGPIRATLQVGGNLVSLDGRAERSGIVTTTALDRTRYRASANLDLPITSEDDGVLAWAGDLSLNARIAWEDVSDFGQLIGYTAGVNWTPLDRFTIITTWVGEENAPSLSQLGAPVQVSPLVNVYDFSRDETAQVSVISGGNPALLAETRRDFRAQVNWRPLEQAEFNLTASYARTRSFDTTSGLPLLTPQIEAAFADRVTRDSAGRLTAIDQRPVNFAATRSRQIRYGFNFARQFGTAGNRAPTASAMGGAPARPGAPAAGNAPAVTPATPTGAPSAAVPSAAPGAAPSAQAPAPAAPTPNGAAPPRPGGFGGPGGPRAGGGGARGPGGGGGRGGFSMFGPPGGGRWSLGLFHTIRLQDEILIRDGVPTLDLLDGASGGGGVISRHEVELQGGVFYRGIGMFAFGSWNSPSRIAGGPIAGGGTSDDLRFGAQTRINLRTFIDFGQRPALLQAMPFLRNARMRLSIDNLFDSARAVTDEGGLVPLRYQRGYLDPVGRTFELSFRKQF